MVVYKFCPSPHPKNNTEIPRPTHFLRWRCLKLKVCPMRRGQHACWTCSFNRFEKDTHLVCLKPNSSSQIRRWRVQSNDKSKRWSGSSHSRHTKSKGIGNLRKLLCENHVSPRAGSIPNTSSSGYLNFEADSRRRLAKRHKTHYLRGSQIQNRLCHPRRPTRFPLRHHEPWRVVQCHILLRQMSSIYRTRILMEDLSIILNHGSSMGVQCPNSCSSGSC